MIKHLFLVLVSFCLQAIFTGVMSQEAMPIIKLEVSPQTLVRPDSYVSFTCRLSGFDHNTIVNYNKVVLKDPRNPVREEITQSTALKNIYKKMERFEVSRHTEGTDLLFILTIKGVLLEDSGTYSCSANHDEHGQQYAVVPLEVYRNPERVYLNMNESVIVKEGDEFPLVCTSSRSMPIPKVEMWITGGEHVEHHQQMDSSLGSKLSDIINKLRGDLSQRWREVTDKFLTSSDMNLYCSGLPGSKEDCPLHFDYEVTSENRDFKPEVRHDGQNVTCLVTMREFEQETFTVSTTLTVHYAPKLVCMNMDNFVSKVHVNTTNHSFSCKVWANPPFNESDENSIQWSDQPCNREKVKFIEKDGENYLTREDGMSADGKNRTVVLVFKKAINKEHFNMKYCLRLRNDAGQTKQEFSLRDYNEPTKAAANNFVTSQVMALLGTALLCVARVSEKLFI